MCPTRWGLGALPDPPQWHPNSPWHGDGLLPAFPVTQYPAPAADSSRRHVRSPGSHKCVKTFFSHDILNVCVLRTRAPIEGDSEPPRTPRTQRPTRAGDMFGTLEVILVLFNSPNSCLQTVGPSVESLYPVLGCRLCPAQTTSFLSQILTNIQIFEVRNSTCRCGSSKSIKNKVRVVCVCRRALFENVAVAPARIKMSQYVSCAPSLVPHTSLVNTKEIHQT